MVKFLDLQKINSSFQPELSEVVCQTIASGWYLRGNATRIFEENFAAYCQCKYCVGVANGLDALTLILMAQKQLEGWEDYAEVIVPDMTFVATAQAVIRAGLRPVFVDVDQNALIDITLLQRSITPSTRAIIAVHLYGQCVNMANLWEVAKKNNLFVLEDAAQAHGIAGKGPSHALAFSFYPGKNLGALGDGGAVVTNDHGLAETIRAMANYGSRKKYYHEMAGCNSRLDEIQAAVLNLKLQRLDVDNARRSDIAQQYYDELTPVAMQNSGFCLLPSGHDTVHHIFPIFCEHREALQQSLLSSGIETLIHYPIPLHRQPCLAAYATAEQAFPQAERIARTELSLPMSPLLTKQEVSKVTSAIKQYYIL